MRGHDRRPSGVSLRAFPRLPRYAFRFPCRLHAAGPGRDVDDSASPIRLLHNGFYANCSSRALPARSPVLSRPSRKSIMQTARLRIRGYAAIPAPLSGPPPEARISELFFSFLVNRSPVQPSRRSISSRTAFVTGIPDDGTPHPFLHQLKRNPK